MSWTSRIVGVVVAAASTVAAVFSLALAQDAITLKVSHFLPPNHTFQKQLVAWGDELNQMSHGRLKLQIYPAAQLGPVNRQYDMARNGIVDISVVLQGATPGRFPMSELISLPYIHPSAGSSSEIASRRLTELAPKYLASENPGVKILWMNVTNPLLFFTTKQPLNMLADFKGLRIRYAGKQFADIITRLGATPLAVPPAETQDSLAKGIIDGATFPYEAAKSFDLGTVVKYSLEPGVSSATFGIVMNKSKYDALPADLRGLIDKTTGPDRAAIVGKAFDAAEKAGRDYMVAKHVKIIEMGEAELAATKNAVAPVTAAATSALDKSGKPASAFLSAYEK